MKKIKPLLLSILIIPLSMFIIKVIYNVEVNMLGYNELVDLIFSLIITIISYLTYPVLYVSSNGKQNNNKSFKIAIINSFIICLFIMELKSSFNLNNNFTYIPAIIYGVINYAILSENKENDKMQ